MEGWMVEWDLEITDRKQGKMLLSGQGATKVPSLPISYVLLCHPKGYNGDGK